MIVSGALLSPHTSDMTVEFLVFLYLLCLIHSLPKASCLQLVLVLYCFFVFCCFRRGLFSLVLALWPGTASRVSTSVSFKQTVVQIKGGSA